jgi:glycosyltransferase involved in cell wall biosynthesis
MFLTADTLKGVLTRYPAWRGSYFTLAAMACRAGMRSGGLYQFARLFMVHYKHLCGLVQEANGTCRSDGRVERLYSRILRGMIERYVGSGGALYRCYLKSKESIAHRRYFHHLDECHRLRLRYPRTEDFVQRQGDLMILKPHTPQNQEKGVLIIHYTNTLGKFASLFDLHALSRHYRLVLEPSWWGYQHVHFLFFLGLPTDVLIESPYKPDFDFIQGLGHNFHPLRIGAGDWADPALFQDGRYGSKRFDIVMVGNWSKIKRHETLFRAVSRMERRDGIRIALVGYPNQGRSKADVLKEAARHGLDDRIAIFENVKPETVADVLKKSKVNVLLSKGEGANRGIYEGLFAGNVLVVSAVNKGVNKEIINEFTGYWANDDELHLVLERALAEYPNFATGSWARSHTGYEVSTRTLNDHLKRLALRQGEPWTGNIAPKFNKPNNLYADDADRRALDRAYDDLKRFLRPAR